MLQRNLQNLSLLVAVFTCFLHLNASAQNPDSLAIAQAKWNSKEIKKGITWHQGHFSNLFNAQQEINWIEIDLKKHAKKVHFEADPKILKKTSVFAEENDALAAINAGFFDMKNGGAVDYIRVNHQIVNLGGKIAGRATAVLTLDGKKVQIASAMDIDPVTSKAANVMVAGPLLIQDQQIIPLGNNPFNTNRHPRTAVAITQKNKLILLVVDGRSNQSYGMSLPELASVMAWLGAKDAMNLDGGGSTTMYVKGATPNHIVNYPSDNKKFDHEGQRSVANIIYIK